MLALLIENGLTVLLANGFALVVNGLVYTVLEYLNFDYYPLLLYPVLK